jgi:hypothetical protein
MPKYQYRPFSSVVEHSLGKGEATCSIHVKGTILSRRGSRVRVPSAPPDLSKAVLPLGEHGFLLCPFSKSVPRSARARAAAPARSVDPSRCSTPTAANVVFRAAIAAGSSARSTLRSLSSTRCTKRAGRCSASHHSARRSCRAHRGRPCSRPATIARFGRWAPDTIVAIISSKSASGPAPAGGRAGQLPVQRFELEHADALGKRLPGQPGRRTDSRGGSPAPCIRPWSAGWPAAPA